MVESTNQTTNQKHTHNLEEDKSNPTSAATSSAAERNAANNMVQATKDAELVIDTSEQIEIVSTFD